MSEGNLFDRRDVLSQFAVTAAATFFGTTAVSELAVAAEAKTLDLKSAGPETFRPSVGEYWKISGQSLLFESVQVINDPNRLKRPRGIRRDSFSLLLSAPAGVSLAAGIYAVKSPKLGRFSVYLNEVRLTSLFPSSSAVGQAELFLSGVTASLKHDSAPKAYFEIPFN